MTTFPQFAIKVLILNRSDPIESPPFEDRAAAEGDLDTIQEAQQGNTAISLPWLKMNGNHVQAAYLEDRTTFAP